MRIAVLTSLFPSSVRPHEGLFAERRWTRMKLRGHGVSVIAPLPYAPLALGRRDWSEIGRTPRRETRSGIEIERPRYLHVPRFPRANARAFARTGVRSVLARGRPDVVVADYAWPAAAAAEALRAQRVPFLVSGRGSDVLQVAGEPALKPLLASALARAGHWCAVSQHLVDAMDSLAGRPGHGVLVANGVDVELFRLQAREVARREVGGSEGELVVLVVGHLIERKDPLLALAVFEALPSALRERARIVFVGRGPLEERLRAEARARGLEPRVRLLGELEPAQLANWYSAADALLLTSSREGRPNVVLEALACGLPVLATDAGGTAELLVGLEGMLARTREPRELAAMLARLLELKPDRDALRRRAEGMSWERGLDELERCLARAIEESRAP